ncbi:MAG TPA: LuxR C-terminal-related transcriptional regulator [Clostridia bacterium]|nr:LuxR C-terminal-related transcriptional regulator [Clostridia bacterium]
MGRKKNGKAELHYFSDRLKQKLDALLLAPATVVEAPSGYGKTTAVRDFLDERLPQDTPVYWFTATDEAPAAGFRRLCCEIDKIDSHAGERLMKIELPNAVTTGEACDALRCIQCRHEAYLVIDNFQFLHTSLPPSFFIALIEHGGEGLHIIIVTQMLKRNMLSVIAGHGFLHITAADLRLNADDIRHYYALAGVKIVPEDARAVEHYTEGWIIAVYLQLCAFIDTGVLSGTPGILALMEHLIWDTLTGEQQIFLLCLSPFEIVTVQQACTLAGCEVLPEYAANALESPFIRREAAGGRYELHSILRQLLIQKREECGAVFERECLLRAGDFCRDEGRIAKALEFYWEIRDYDSMLSLDLSHMLLENIGEVPFYELALDIARNCPAGIKKRHILSMLRVSWALCMNGIKDQFEALLEELHELPELTGEPGLIGEWLLLSAYRCYPRLDEMTGLLRQAVPIFRGKCSKVILPAAPWCFGSYCPLADFHIRPGEADLEADALEEYIALYSRLTGGHGSGVDVLYRAELAYQRGNISEAEILAYKAVFLAESRQQSIVQLGAARLLASVALHKADTAGWQHAIGSMERALSYPLQNNFVVRSGLDIVRGVLLSELKHHMDIADWLQSGEFMKYMTDIPMLGDALFVHINYLMHQGENVKLIGTVQASRVKIQIFHPFAELLMSLVEAVGYAQLGDRNRAAALVESATHSGLPDGIIFPLASYSWALNGVADELFKEKFPGHLDEFNRIKERFSRGWDKLYKDMLPEELPPDLTPREYEVAKLAAEGLRNSEIAEKLMVTESTVRTHLRTAFQKLDVDRRAKLAEKLK